VLRVALGTVNRWSDEDGWGVLTSPEVPGEVFAHFAHIEAEGYRSLDDGEHVEFEWEHFPPGQDGYYYRATRIARLTK
jgi:CspA family cold shock protein